MSRPPVRKTENVKTAPVTGVIGGVFGRMRGEKAGAFRLGTARRAPRLRRGRGGLRPPLRPCGAWPALRAEFSPFAGRVTPPTPQKGLAKAGTVCYTFERCQYRRKELLK